MTSSLTLEPTRVALRGDLLDFTALPEWGAVESPAVRFRADHWLLISDGRIVGVQAGTQTPDERWAKHDHRGCLIQPGFIDTHVHSPQLDVIASYSGELLEWLQSYTYPAELRYADAALAQTGAERFLDALLAHGSTSAVVFPTVHRVSADTLFAAARARGLKYGQLIASLRKAQVRLDRKQLAELAINDAAAFDQLVATAGEQSIVHSP